MAKRLPGQYSKQTKAQSRATIKAQLKADIKSGKMKMAKNEVPFGGVSKAILKYATRTGARIIADRKGAQIVAEKTARRKAPVVTNAKDDLRKDLGGSGGGNIYRAPGRNNRPRLRDTDNTPCKTTVRQQVGPKTKSGKFVEKKYPSKTNTQPPARTKSEKPKVELPAVTTVRGRVIAINKKSPNLRIRKSQEARLRIGREEFLNARERQAKLAARREPKIIKQSDSEKNIPVYSKNNVKYYIRVPRSSKTNVEARPAQPTIESRVASGAEKLDITSRNASKPPQTSTAEWRKYAQQMRDSNAKAPNVTKSQINRGRARALMPTAERRAIDIKATQNRAVAKAKARGMSDAQISQMIAKARKEAAIIAKKASK